MSVKKQEVVTLVSDQVPTVPTSALARAEPSETMVLIHMIERVARDPSVDLERLKELLAMKREMLEREARLAFDASFSEMQPALPIIDEKGVHAGTKSSYAKWDDVMESIAPVLGAHGFGLRFRIKQESGKVLITGMLRHSGGHSEETTIELPIDASGQKNAVQAIGSSVSYGQRYVAKAMLGLSSRKSEDDNGDAALSGDCIDEKQLERLIDLADEVGADKARFCTYFKIDGFAKLPKAKFQTAMGMLEAKRKHA